MRSCAIAICETLMRDTINIVLFMLKAPNEILPRRDKLRNRYEIVKSMCDHYFLVGIAILTFLNSVQLGRRGRKP